MDLGTRRVVGIRKQVDGVVTGASHGLGEASVKTYRERGWRAVGNARTITPSDEPDYITVAGDVGDPVIARRVVETARATM